MLLSRRALLFGVGSGCLLGGCATREAPPPDFATAQLPPTLGLERDDALATMRRRDAHCLVVRVPVDDAGMERFANDLLDAVEGLGPGIALPLLLKRSVLLFLPATAWPHLPPHDVVQIDAQGKILGTTDVDWGDRDASLEAMHRLLDGTEREERRRAPDDPRFEIGRADLERFFTSSRTGVRFAPAHESREVWRRMELSLRARAWPIRAWREKPTSEAGELVRMLATGSMVWTADERRGGFGPIPFGTRLEAREDTPDPRLAPFGRDGNPKTLRARYRLRFLRS